MEKLATHAAAPPFEAPALNEAQQRALEGLRADGIAVAHVTDLFDKSLWAELQADTKGFVAETEEWLLTEGANRTKKDAVIRRRWFSKAKDAPKPHFTFDSPWFRVVASDTMLDVVNRYRGQWTQLYYADNWYTIPSRDSDKRISSQRWHRDPEEEHVVKVFLYVNDIDVDAGPFEYVRSSITGGRYGDVFRWEKDSDHYYPPHDELMAAVAPEDVLTLTGPAGTLIFCDTSGFHRGGFARTKPRILFMGTYVSPAAEIGHRFTVDLGGREAELPAQVRFALA
jgi:hypothetical protein